MSDIRVRWRGGDRTFGDDRPVRVGRAASCEVLVLDERVSRDPHLVLRFEGARWILEDKSSGGTWSNGQRIGTVSLPHAHTFNLGAPDGPELTVEPLVVPAAVVPPSPSTPNHEETAAEPVAAPDAPPDPGEALLAEAARLDAAAAPPAPAAAGPAPVAPTPVPSQPGPAPGLPPPPAPQPPAPPGRPAPSFDPSLTVSLDDRALRLSYEDKELVIPPGYAVTIGRDPGCDLVIDHPIVSRQHARFTHDGSNWVLEDLDSTRGTFIDGTRVKRPRRVEGVFEISLGDDTAGERVRVITASEHTVPPRLRSVVLYAVAAVLGLAGIMTAADLSGLTDGDSPRTTVVQQDDDDGGGGRDANTAEQLAAVKESTVLIEAVDSSGRSLWTGSGTVIDDDGHILTNAHVADPEAASLDALVPLLGGLRNRTPAAGFVIHVSPSEDAAAEPRYLAEWVASSATQDASIIQITRDADTGDPVADLPFTAVPIGSSGDLRAGAKIHSLGYPANSTTLSISVLEGEVVSFVSADEFREIVGGDDRKVMNTSAVLGQGSSGGPIVRDGKVVGVNATLSTADGLDRGWAVPIDEIAPLLAEVNLSPES